MDIIGWVAALRRFQAGAAGLWIVYGLSINALPVVIANVIVAAAAVFSLSRPQKETQQPLT